MKIFNSHNLIFLWAPIFISISSLGQESNAIEQDSIKSISLGLKDQKRDTVKMVSGSSTGQLKKNESNQEISPLDISDDSGIYIMANNGKSQFRILGSVRFSALMDNRLMSDKSRFSTYDIPTGDNDFRVLNYYNTLMFTRIGFEVTRTTSIGNIFIRLETDFAGIADGQSSAYRIRQAYGQFNDWLIGQTWSLFSNVNAQTASVNRNGPPGTISLRTPQIRYSFKLPLRDIEASASLEYSLPEVSSNDSIAKTSVNVQTVPNLAIKLSKKKDFGYLQLSGIFAPITGVDITGSKSSLFGFGVSFSGYYNTPSNSKLLFQATYGRAISHFINMFRNSENDLIYNPNSQEFEALNSISGNLSYEHRWNDKIISNLSFGMGDVENKDYQDPTAYNFSYSASTNTFYTLVKGARVGLEYMFGQRFNINDTKGRGNRLWALFYYDF